MADEILYTGRLESKELLRLIADCRIPENDERILFLAESLPTHVIDPNDREERLNLLKFTFYSSKLSFENYTSGRIFHPDWELRWEHRDGSVHIVYLGQQSEAVREVMDHYRMKVKAKDNPTAEDNLINLQDLSQHKRCYYLFGKRLADEDVKLIGSPAQVGDFAELRIHRILRYPVPVSIGDEEKKRVRLGVREYLDKNLGRVQFFRFQDLKEVIEGKEQACDESL